MHVILRRKSQHCRESLAGTGSRFAWCALLICALLPIIPGAANAAPATKLVRYRGYAMRVPARWPVFVLRRRPSVCVRFNRHAVYLGKPSARQRCPVDAAGRTEAILAAPLTGSSGARHGSTAAPLAPVTVPGAQPADGSETQFAIRRRGVEVTATWGRHRSIISRALGVRLRHPARATAAAVQADASTAVQADASAAEQANARPRATGTVYEGLGVDACSAPSSSQMAAWGASPYRALGVYIGGTNMACSQPNLTAAWVAQEWAAGWHLIPTYVGLQAPGNSCGCASISPSQAAAQGAAAAIDAVTRAQAIGIGPGSPIYDDMEGYSAGGTATTAVLAFLQAWTAQLHAEGYGAGVYSSTDSGIPDLAAQFGTTYLEPDDIWFAHWNDVKSVSDPAIPSADWAANQRIHQYRGGHNETYGGVTINVDNNYVDGATAFGASTPLAPLPPPAPSLKVSTSANGTIRVSASWPGGASVAHWRVIGGSTPAALLPLTQHRPTGRTTTIALHSAFPYYAVQALNAAGQVEASSATVAAGRHLAIYGRSAFVPAGGFVGVPVGCFTGSTCRIALTVTAGREVVARTGRELLGSTGGLVFFRLSASGRSLLAHARGRRLPVTVKARDVSGATASTTINLIPFIATGSAPHRRATQAGTVRIIGSQDFAWLHTFGGLLAGCTGSAPCKVTIHLTAKGGTIATAASGTIGANEAGYLLFRLNPLGRALLAKAPGNMLNVRVTLTDGTATAHAQIALSSFS